MQTKETNPKDAIAIGKLSFSVLPWQVLCRVALGMMEGAAKYGRHNFRGVGVRASVYFDAAVARHLTEWWEGEDIDAASGLHHVDKAIACLMVMRDSMLQGNFVDDRPMRGKGVNMEELNAHAARILALHADKSPRHYTIADDALAEHAAREEDARLVEGANAAAAEYSGFDGWIPHDADGCVFVDGLQPVEVVLSNGSRKRGLVKDFSWEIDHCAGDIIFYRLARDE